MSEIKEQIDEQLGGGLTKAEKLYNDNKRTVLIAGGVIVVLVLGFFGFKYMQSNKQEEANGKLFYIENYFEQDSLDMALNGDPKAADPIGAIEFVEEYGGTPAGQRAAFIAGYCYMKKGDFSTAIDYFKKFKIDDMMYRPLVDGLIGDCYSELGNLEEAEDYYKKAVAQSDNPFTAPRFLKKLGLVQENLGNAKAAAENYNKIKTDYPESDEAKDIERYVARASAKAGISSFEN